jgi:caa(3)-type oxidase subunit IV
LSDVAVHAADAHGHDDHGHGDHGHSAGHGHHTSLGLSNNKLGMWLFLGSECLLFGGLISTYMLYRGRVNAGPGPDQVYDIPFTSVSSFVLLMSSLTMVFAVTAAKRRDDRNVKLWLTVTALLGATFVGGQVYEFTAFYREGMGFTTSLFSSSFYTLTGFHGVHVTVGIIMLMALRGILAKNKVPGDKAEVVELVGLYWHFVDIVWVVIFTLVYLIPAYHDEHVHPDSYYVKVALVLAVLTALETSTYWVDFGPLFLPALFIMMAIKFVIIAAVFMHLRGDSKWFNYAFWTGLILAILVYAGALSTFKFFIAP